MKRSLITLSVVGLMLAGVAGAAVQKGDTELNLAGSFTYTSLADDAGGGSTTVFSLMIGAGYFVTDNIRLGVSTIDAWGGGASAYIAGVDAKYHFMPTNQLVPYVGGQIAGSFIDPGGLGDTLTTYMYGPIAGARWELNEKNDFFVEYQFQLFGGDTTFDNIHTVMFGIVHQFK
jgi:hypothetical protein